MKKSAPEKQRKLQSAGLSKRSAENRAWDEANKARTNRASGTAGGRSKISKRTTKPKGSTKKTKTTGKARR